MIVEMSYESNHIINKLTKIQLYSSIYIWKYKENLIKNIAYNSIVIISILINKQIAKLRKGIGRQSKKKYN